MMKRLLSILSVIGYLLLETTPASAERLRSLDGTRDWVEIIDAEPESGHHFRYGETVRFVVAVRYHLESVSRADLSIAIAQLPKSNSRCDSTRGELIDAGRTEISRGEGVTKVRVSWRGGAGARIWQVESGFLTFHPTLLRVGSHNHITSFEHDPSFCYSFSPERDRDWVEIIDSKPESGQHFRYGEAVRFVVAVRYHLESVPRADLVISIAQLPNSDSRCDSNRGEMIDSGRTEITRGEGVTKVRVSWRGGAGARVEQFTSGFLTFMPTLWRVGTNEIVARVEHDPSYCYSFSP